MGDAWKILREHVNEEKKKQLEKTHLSMCALLSDLLYPTLIYSMSNIATESERMNSSHELSYTKKIF